MSSPFNSLGRLTGVKINPFRIQDSKITSPQLNLDDALSVAGWAKNPAASLLGDALGSLSSPAGGGNGPSRGEALTELSAFAAELARREVQRNLTTEPTRNDLIDQAVASLSPGSSLTLAQRFRTTSLQQGRKAAERRAMEARAKGYATGVQSGIAEEAESQANDLAGRMLADLLSPESGAKRAVAAADLLRPSLSATAFAFSNQRQNISDSQRQQLFDRQMEATRPASLGESLVALAPEIIASYLETQKRKKSQTDLLAAARRYLR